ncbi:MAG: methyltransferase domain-containing protein [Candidatus Thiodiazotropha endolucinida]
MMAARDPHRFVNDLGDEAVERLITRLESRAKDSVFTSLIDKYSSQLILTDPAKVLEVGCGTGAMIRSFVRSKDFNGHAVGVDQSGSFINAAKSFARYEHLENRLHFQIGDAHDLDFPSASFDTVIANTLISHVSDPARVLEEMARVVWPGGIIAVFDGDYASLTYAFPDHDFGRQMDSALATASFNNPRVMRDLPRMLDTYGLQLVSAWGDAVVEIGEGSYFKSFAETYAPYVTISGLMDEDEVDSWLSVQLEAMESGTFFASCNYYTYLFRRV